VACLGGKPCICWKQIKGGRSWVVVVFVCIVVVVVVAADDDVIVVVLGRGFVYIIFGWGWG